MNKGYVNLRTRMELIEALLKNGTANVAVRAHGGELVLGILDSVERESGSGRSFNLTLNTKDGPKTVYWMSID